MIMTATFPQLGRSPIGRRLGCVLLAAGLTSAAIGLAAGPPATVRLELSRGGALSGSLVAIADESIRVETGGQARDVPTADVRRLMRDRGAPAPGPTVLVTTRDGGLLGGTGGRQEGDRWLIERPEGLISLPVERVARVAWLGADERQPAWLADLPGQPTADLLVIRKNDGHTFVECAVTAVSDDAVRVVLDGETIPVKRAKVAGIIWLREPLAAANGPVVTVAGGRLTADTIRWSPEVFVIDGSIELPPALLESINYAAGRTIPLATLKPEATEVDPAFGSLAAMEGMAGFFAPRAVASGADTPPDLAVRPRTVATWRVPANVRQFRTGITRDVPETSPAAVEVTVAIDDRQAFRARLAAAAGGDDDAGADPIAIDVTNGRRLTLTVDFSGSSLGCPVRLIEPVFEQ